LNLNSPQCNWGLRSPPPRPPTPNGVEL
jgi:hypothetical protein